MAVAYNVAESKRCRQCGEEFQPTSNRQAECGAKCYILRRSEMNEAGCRIWKGKPMNSGYGGTSRGPAHRYAYEAFVGEILPGMEVCHSCDVRLCVNPDHLRLGTHFENMEECARKGRNSRKLTDAQVLSIRAAPKSMSHASLGREHGVSEVMVAKIRKGEWWKFLLANEVAKNSQIT